MASTNSNTANNGTNADSSNGGGRVRQHEERTREMAPPEAVGTFRRTFQSNFISMFTGKRCQLQPVEHNIQRVSPEESVGASLQTHPKVQMHPLLQRNAMSPTNASKNSLLNMLATKHEASVQRAMKEDAEGGQSGEREPQAVKGPITYTLDDSAKGKWNNTGLVFRHVDGKPLTSEEVYRFIRDEKAAGNTELQELLPMRADAWYKERGQEPPRFTIENSQHTYYGYAGNGGRSPSVAEGPGQDGRFPSVAEGPGSGGPTLPILDWPKAPDYQNFGSPADRDNRDSYQIVQGYYVLTRATNGGDRYYFLPVTEKGNPQPNWTPFTPKGLAAKQARDADPMGYAYMRGIADGWTGLVEADYTEIGHTALDYIGMVPIIGEPADMINAVWYAAEGNYLDAFLSSGAAVPMAGYAFNVIKNGRRAMKIFNRGGKVVVETVAGKVDEVVEGAVKMGDDVVEEGAEKLGKEVDTRKVKQDAPDAQKPKDVETPHPKPETQTPKEYSEGEMENLKKQDENSPIDKETKKTDPNYASKRQASLIAQNILTAGDNANQDPKTLLPALWPLTAYKGVRGFSFVPIGADKFQFYLHGSKEEVNPQDGVYDVKVEAEKISTGRIDSALIKEMTEAGVKFSLENLQFVAKNNEGLIMFLEKGNPAAGLQHIIDGKWTNKPNFQSLFNNNIDEMVDNMFSSIKNGTFLEKTIDGKNRLSYVYQVQTSQGLRNFKFATGSNGFIVSFIPNWL